LILIISLDIIPANDAFSLNLVRPDGKADNRQRVFEEPFHPEFTYDIFGEEEQVFGYTDLELDLDFRANDLKPSLRISYGEKWKPVGETKAMDLNAMLREALPECMSILLSFDLGVSQEGNDRLTFADAFEGAPDYTLGPDATDSSWKPPGKLLHSYTLHGREFEIWSASLADPVAKEIFRRMQIFVSFYIEGGTRQKLDDAAWTMERWTLFLTYEITPLKEACGVSPYTIVGFATSYRLWIFPTAEIMKATSKASNGNASYIPPPVAIDIETSEYLEPYDPLSAQSRERISQFVILPPYQKTSHGSHLYNAMFASFIATPNIYEITVEDPNEAFDDMRDYCDILYLRSLPEFAALSLPSTIPASHLVKDAKIPTDLILGPEEIRTALRHKSKISPRQFKRVLEMQLLSGIPPRHRSTNRITRKEKSADENDRWYYFWRLALKERLFLHNVDSLMQLDADERVEKVEETAKGVQADYERLLEGVEKRVKWAAQEAFASTPSSNAKWKRRRVIESEEDDDDDEAGERETVASKRPKIS
jgi:histone acetyltransferase 1